METRTKKHCPGCCPSGVEIPVDRFGPNAARPDGLQAQCRSCLTAIQVRSRKTRIEVERARGKRNRDAIREANRRLLLQYLQDHPCVDCGEADPVVLEFDHRGHEEKVDTVVALVNNCYSWAAILKEIQKCDVRCANCHRRKTSREAGSFRLTPPGDQKDVA